MPYIDGIVYAEKTSSSDLGVDVRDVQKALGTSRHYLNELCTHQNINVWAKYKPVRFDQLDTTRHPNRNESWLNSDKTWNSNAQWWRYRKIDFSESNYRCGFLIPLERGITENVENELQSWQYLRPEGQGTRDGVPFFEPYRLADFNQYYSRAICPFSITYPDKGVISHELQSNGRTKDVINGLIMISRYMPIDIDERTLNLTLNEVLGLGTSVPIDIGIAAVKGSNVYVRTQASVSDASITLEGLEDCGISKNDTIRLVAFGSRVSQPTWSGEFNHDVFSLKAPNLSFPIAASIQIKEESVDKYLIKVSGNLTTHDQNFMRMDTHGATKSGGYVSSHTQPTTQSSDDLQRDYYLIKINVVVKKMPGEEVVWSRSDYNPDSLNAIEPYIEKGAATYVGYTLRCSTVENDAVLPEIDRTSYYFRWEYEFVYHHYS